MLFSLKENYKDICESRNIPTNWRKRNIISKILLDKNSFYLGNVYAGSGLYHVKRRANNTMYYMDWTLISIAPERLGVTSLSSFPVRGCTSIDPDATFGPSIQI
ncbi:hypothetical protein MW887_006105 [Aspergillus wentii]|nr:hypothetical protein MW887_006105 [Aspergillus wentii]